jgi:hypothetical protein
VAEGTGVEVGTTHSSARLYARVLDTAVDAPRVSVTLAVSASSHPPGRSAISEYVKVNGSAADHLKVVPPSDTVMSGSGRVATALIPGGNVTSASTVSIEGKARVRGSK